MSTTLAQDPVLTRLRAGLEEVYGEKLARVVLFGSRARGDHTEESDYDVAVFLYEPGTRWDELGRLAFVTTDLLIETKEFVTALPFLASDYDADRPLMREIRRDGVDI